MNGKDDENDEFDLPKVPKYDEDDDQSEASSEWDGHRLVALGLSHLDLPGNSWWPLRQDGPLSN